MRKVKVFLITIFLLIFFTLSSISNFSSALDELYLTGKIIEYDSSTGKIKVDVFSESCKGIKEFYTSKGLPKEKLIDKVIDFGIDSDHCDRHKIHKITTSLLE